MRLGFVGGDGLEYVWLARAFCEAVAIGRRASTRMSSTGWSLTFWHAERKARFLAPRSRSEGNGSGHPRAPTRTCNIEAGNQEVCLPASAPLGSSLSHSSA